MLNASVLKAIFWKEWRQQRSFLLAIVLLGTILIGAFSWIVGFHWDKDFSIFDKLAIMSLLTAVIQAMVTGSMLFAGEVESGTLDFLDACVADRSRIWLAKVVSALILALPFLALLLLLGGSMTVPVLVFLVAILLLSAACSVFARTTIRAVGMVAAFLLGFGVVIGYLEHKSDLATFAAYTFPFAVVFVTVIASWRRFCGHDSGRRAGISKSFPLRLPASWMTGSLWLMASRQWRTALVVGAAIVAFVCWAAMPKHGYDAFMAAPLVAFAVGCVAGWSVFGLEQSGAERFLGDQRFPRNRLWLAKVGGWMALTLVATWIIAHFAALWCRERFVPNEIAEVGGRAVLFALLGFSAGQFFGIHDRRSPVTMFLTLAVAGPIAVAWYAPMFFGAPIWPFAVVPILFLAATRFELGRWMAGRLEGIGRIVRWAVVVLAAFAWTGLLLWQRIVEIPDVGEPFVAAAIPVETPEERERDVRIQEAAVLARRQFDRLFRDPNTRMELTLDYSRWQEPGIDFGEAQPRELGDLADQVFALGAPDEKRDEFAGQISEAFEGDWATKLRDELAQEPRPLPRSSNSDDRRKTAALLDDAQLLLLMRSLLHVAEDRTDAGLEDLELALEIARLRIPFRMGGEWLALESVETMLRRKAGDAAFCRRLLGVLNRHAARWPPFLDTMKASYSSSNSDWHFAGPVASLLLDDSRESIRSDRLRRAYFRGVLIAAESKALQPFPRYRERIPWWVARYLALAVPDRSVDDWARLISRDRYLQIQVGVDLDVGRTRDRLGISTPFDWRAAAALPT